MDESLRNNSLLEGQLTYQSEQDGLKKYLITTTVELRNEDNRTQILSIGMPNNLPAKCVLLLGETGAGKTTLVNGVINYLYGISFHDDYRVCVKEESIVTAEVSGCERMDTESQTDYITMYILYHQKGMKYECNFVLIDTPGLADTRGTQQQKSVMKHLEEFLTTDYRIDHLHCIGLVAKACTNRDFTSQKDILSEVRSLLGNNVPEITNLFATFAVEKPSVDQIVRNAGVRFKIMFEFDNGVLFASHRLSDSLRERDRRVLEYRWEIMEEQYGTFFKALMDAPAVSVQILREKKLLQKSVKELKLHIEELARLLTALETNKKKLVKYELQEARNRDWRREVRVERKNRLAVEEGFHAHNCPQCNQTCIFPCPPENDAQNASIIGGMAGVLGGSAAGAAATQATINSVAAATRAAASSSGVAATVGGWVTRVLGGSVAATEVAAVAGLPGVIMGGMVGITVGVVTGAACGRMLTHTKSCNLSGARGDVCGERGCLHSLSQHLTETERIVELINVEYMINEDVKELYDVAVSKKNDAMVKIVSGKQKVHQKKIQVTMIFA